MLNFYTFIKQLKVSKNQKAYLSELLKEAIYHNINDLSVLINNLTEEELQKVEQEFRDLNMTLDVNGFIYFKQPHTANAIKLHIPLKDYWKDGFIVSNLITANIPMITGIKLTMPVHYNSIEEFNALDESVRRGLKHIPITIYLPETNMAQATDESDNKLHIVENIAYIIQQIDTLLSQIASMPKDNRGNKYGEIKLSDSIDEFDVMIGRYSTLTIGVDKFNNPIYPKEYYREKIAGSGNYTLIEEGEDTRGCILGGEIRKALVQNSYEVNYLKSILPYAEIFHDLHQYINSAPNLPTEETKEESTGASYSTHSSFVLVDWLVNAIGNMFSQNAPDDSQSHTTPVVSNPAIDGQRVLEVMRQILLKNLDSTQEELDINSALSHLEANASISRNENLMGLIAKFRDKYLEINEDISRPSLR